MQRQIGMGASAIPIPVIESWARVHDVEDIAGLVDKIVAMDAEYLNWAQEKQERQKTEQERPKLIMPK